MASELAAVALLIAAGLLVWALARARGAARSVDQLDEALRASLAQGRAMAERIATLESLRDAQAKAEQVLETGGSVVREVHKGIARIPFDILEAIPATRDASKRVRDVHDTITDGVYGALSGLNKAVGRELRKGMKLEETPAPPDALPPGSSDSPGKPPPN